MRQLISFSGRGRAAEAAGVGGLVGQSTPGQVVQLPPADGSVVGGASFRLFDWVAAFGIRDLFGWVGPRFFPLAFAWAFRGWPRQQDSHSPAPPLWLPTTSPTIFLRCRTRC